MNTCPKCGIAFNWWQRITGEKREHIRYCRKTPDCEDRLSMAATCRGCPAGCFEGVYSSKDGKDR